MNERQIGAFQQLLDAAQKIGIITHINPDGDAMGSALALCEHVIAIGKAATVISPTPVNEALNWLPGSASVFVFDDKEEEHQQKLQEFDTIIFVDHSSKGRCGNIPNFLYAPKAKRAYIDHHPTPDFDVAVAISEVESAATCCILYEVLAEMNALITPNMATCLYTGIVTDTGNFRYGKNSAQVFRIASKLVQLGIDKEAITEAIYYTNSENRLRFLGFVLKEKMHRVGLQAAYITITQQEITDNNVKYTDTEDFVNYPLSISDVFISAIFIEKEDHIKISFRSRGEFDVNLLARNHFNGGGHKNASGGRFYGTMQEAVDLYNRNIN